MKPKYPENNNPSTTKEEKPFWGLMIHSFFVIPFFIALSCVLLYSGMKLLTREQRDAYDYLEDVRVGSLSKRWQSAFELSKMLNNPDLIPDDARFAEKMISAFQNARHDDKRVRRYLALAMGRTGNPKFLSPLLKDISTEEGEDLYAFIYALGMLKDKRGARVLHQYLDHSNARIRSATVASLGNIGDVHSKKFLKKSLSDPEPNVQWGSALSLAEMGDAAGKMIIAQLLNREYLKQFPAVDAQEQNYLMLAAIKAAENLNEPDLHKRIKKLAATEKDMKVRSAAIAAGKIYERRD